ncbi:tegument protein VP11/12 [Macropodid alphaherpesvirus 1]|uniref:Tegument protein VP11/12 n=1 Tax=Macropodid alphaherpesvirus 1 TaxID=137443 RepID=A0A109Z776_9ALPH|nr:tegument protein VP11/12 [Macropodid alphaherpesvirus 1]AMB17004.1 tegument protein VP11/12 [Macropodid alphaherpesvirus 1]
MHRYQRRSTSSNTPGCVTSRELGRTRNPSFLPQRIHGSCILPTPDCLIGSAVRALRYHSDELQPPFLTDADRAMRVDITSNSVPEDLILDGISRDAQRTYFKHYLAAAKRSLVDNELTNDELWRGIQMQYWKYFQRVVEGKITIPAPQARDRDPSVHVLLRSSVTPKLLSRSPFKPPEQSAKYTQTICKLYEATHKIQQYLYYMRPDRADAPSEVTALRLSELLAYVSVLYKWADCMMLITDKYICECLDPSHQQLKISSRNLPQSGTLFSQHLTHGPGAGSKSLECYALRTLVSDVLGYLTHVAHLWEFGKRRRGDGGTPDTIVATIEILALVHHHAQYIINTVLTGYVVWATDGLENIQLRDAVTHQDRFCRVMAPIFPSLTVSSWAEMELGLKAWFTANLATSFLPELTPSPHYETMLQALVGECGSSRCNDGSGAPGAAVPHATDGRRGHNLGRRVGDAADTCPYYARPRVPSARTPRSPLQDPFDANPPTSPRSPLQDPFDANPPTSPRLFSLPITLGGEAVDPLNTLRQLVSTPTYARMDSAPRSPLQPASPHREPPNESIYQPHRAISTRRPTCDGEYLLIRPRVRPPPIGAPAPPRTPGPVHEDPVYEIEDEEESVYEPVRDDSDEESVYEPVRDDNDEEAVYEPVRDDNDPIYTEISDEEPIYEEIQDRPTGRRATASEASRATATGSMQLVNPVYQSTEDLKRAAHPPLTSSDRRANLPHNPSFASRPPQGAFRRSPPQSRLSAPASTSWDTRTRRPRFLKSKAAQPKGR